MIGVGGNIAASNTPDAGWLRAFRAYIGLSAGAHLVWEAIQMPLYTIWLEPWRSIIFAWIHCTGGDILIAASCLWSGLLLAGSGRWPVDRFTRVALLTISAGMGYAVVSEWLNVEVRQTWAYTEAMPRVPLLGTGLTPLLQWILVPTLALALARRQGDK